MKTAIQIVLIPIIMFISSCAYESMVPLEKPAIKINKVYIGSWMGESSGNVYTLSEHTDYIYKLKIHKKHTAEQNIMYGYLSTLNGTVFLNVWDSIPETGSVKFSFFKLELISSDKVRVQPVTENISEQFVNSKDLREYFVSNMHNSYFYEPADVCLRNTSKR